MQAFGYRLVHEEKIKRIHCGEFASGLKVRTQVSTAVSVGASESKALRGVHWTPASFQGCNARFKSGGDHCGYSTTVSTADCGSAYPGSTPGSHPMGR